MGNSNEKMAKGVSAVCEIFGATIDGSSSANNSPRSPSLTDLPPECQRQVEQVRRGILQTREKLIESERYSRNVQAQYEERLKSKKENGSAELMSLKQELDATRRDLETQRQEKQRWMGVVIASGTGTSLSGTFWTRNKFVQHFKSWVSQDVRIFYSALRKVSTLAASMPAMTSQQQLYTLRFLLRMCFLAASDVRDDLCSGVARSLGFRPVAERGSDASSPLPDFCLPVVYAALQNNFEVILDEQRKNYVQHFCGRVHQALNIDSEDMRWLGVGNAGLQHIRKDVATFLVPKSAPRDPLEGFGQLGEHDFSGVVMNALPCCLWVALYSDCSWSWDCGDCVVDEQSDTDVVFYKARSLAGSLRWGILLPEITLSSQNSRVLIGRYLIAEGVSL